MILSSRGGHRRGTFAFATASVAWLLTGCGGSTSTINPGGSSSVINVPSPSVSVPAGQPYTFTAASADGSVLTYKVASGGAGGTVTSAGVYTPPADITQGKTTDTVVVSSASGQTRQITVNLLLAASASPTNATASVTGALPAGAAVPASSRVQFTATVAGDPHNRVTWAVAAAVAGGAVGSIDANGLYTAPPSAANGSQVVVTATPSATNPGGTAITSQAARATVTLQSAGATVPIQ